MQEQDVMVGGGLIALMNDSVRTMAANARRDLRTIIKDLDDELAMMGPERAETWIFSMPFTQWNEETQKREEVLVEGPSIRCAEAVQRAYGFMVSLGSVIEDHGSYLLVAGICVDMAKCNIVGRQRRVPKEQWNRKAGKATPVPAHKLERDNGAAISKCIRDAILASVPDQIKWHCFTEAKLLAGKAKISIDRLLAKFSGIGVTMSQLETLLGHAVATIDSDEHLRLRSIYSTIRSGEATVEEIFVETSTQQQPEAEIDPDVFALLIPDTLKKLASMGIGAGPIEAFAGTSGISHEHHVTLRRLALAGDVAAALRELQPAPSSPSPALDAQHYRREPGDESGSPGPPRRAPEQGTLKLPEKPV